MLHVIAIALYHENNMSIKAERSPEFSQAWYDTRAMLLESFILRVKLTMLDDRTHSAKWFFLKQELLPISPTKDLGSLIRDRR